MTDRIRNHDHHDLGLAEIVGWKPPTNLSVPAYGVVKLSAFADGIFTTTKSDGAEGIYYVNGPVETPLNGYSSSIMWIRAQPVLFDPAADVSVGDACGPVDDEWFMSADGTGWRIFIEPNSDNIAFVLKEGGGGGGGHLIGYEITGVTCVAEVPVSVQTTSAAIDWFTGCGEPPGIDTYSGTYIIYDYYGSLAKLKESELLGAKSLAVYWNSHPGCDPRWDFLMSEWLGGG